MSDELRVSVKLEYSKNGIVEDFIKEDVLSDVAGDEWHKNIQVIGTSEEAVDVGDVAAGGYIGALNLDTTNFVKLRPGSGLTDMIRLDPNSEPSCFRLDDAATLYAIADTGACRVLFFAVDP